MCLCLSVCLSVPKLNFSLFTCIYMHLHAFTCFHMHLHALKAEQLPRPWLFWKRSNASLFYGMLFHLYFKLCLWLQHDMWKNGRVKVRHCWYYVHSTRDFISHISSNFILIRETSLGAWYGFFVVIWMVQWVQIRSKEDREWHLIYELYYVQKQKGNKSLLKIYKNFAVLVRTTLGLFGTGTEAWQFLIQAVCVCVCVCVCESKVSSKP